MNQLESHIQHYLFFCESQKRLDPKTLKAYQNDLAQFSRTISETDISEITVSSLESFIATLHQTYRPKTVKRKIASVKAFFHFLEYRDIIATNPFNKMQLRFREPVILPKVIPLPTLESFFKTVYSRHNRASGCYQQRKTLQDIAIIELLFSTGIRISELCSLRASDVNLFDNTILINGKGAKQRRLQIANDDVISILKQYYDSYREEIRNSNYFFVSGRGTPVSDQAVRRMIKKYAALAGIELNITPHMFRHTFATSLLESDVDIRYIQEMLGHSSINITEIYTHVTTSKQKDILKNKHPRKDFCVQVNSH